MTKVKDIKVKASELELKDKVVNIQRVAKVTKGGRTFSFSALVIVGDENGTVGYGLGKAREVQAAITKGIDDAKVLIKPASDGTGVIAGGSMRAVLESAGIHNVLAKSLGSSNPHNVVKATILALSLLRDPFTVSKDRNISLSKVFNG